MPSTLFNILVFAIIVWGGVVGYLILRRIHKSVPNRGNGVMLDIAYEIQHNPAYKRKYVSLYALVWVGIFILAYIISL
jgi:hypothetical protein